MARVLVVGTDIQGEQALLQRLRLASALPDGQIRRSQDLDDCDLLVIRDTPALRFLGLYMAPQMPPIKPLADADRSPSLPGRTNA